MLGLAPRRYLRLSIHVFALFTILAPSSSVFATKTHSAVKDKDKDGRHLLQGCINDNQPKDDPDNPLSRRSVRGPTTWASTLNDEPSTFRVVGTWWSKQQPAPAVSDPPGDDAASFSSSSSTSGGITLVTHLSFDERFQLKALCRSWKGPLSAVIHFTTMMGNQTALADTAMHWDGVTEEGQQSERMADTAAGAEVGSGGGGSGGRGLRVGEKDAAAADAAADGTGGSSRSTGPAAAVEFDPDANGEDAGLPWSSGGGRRRLAGIHSADDAQRRRLRGSRGGDDGRAQRRGLRGGGGDDDEAVLDVLSVEEARRRAGGLHTTLERMHACRADVLLVHEVYADPRALSMYPGQLLQVGESFWRGQVMG